MTPLERNIYNQLLSLIDDFIETLKSKYIGTEIAGVTNYKGYVDFSIIDIKFNKGEVMYNIQYYTPAHLIPLTSYVKFENIIFKE